MGNIYLFIGQKYLSEYLKLKETVNRNFLIYLVFKSRAGKVSNS